MESHISAYIHTIALVGVALLGVLLSVLSFSAKFGAFPIKRAITYCIISLFIMGLTIIVAATLPLLIRSPFVLYLSIVIEIFSFLLILYRLLISAKQALPQRDNGVQTPDHDVIQIGHRGVTARSEFDWLAWVMISLSSALIFGALFLLVVTISEGLKHPKVTSTHTICSAEEGELCTSPSIRGDGRFLAYRTGRDYTKGGQGTRIAVIDIQDPQLKEKTDYKPAPAVPNLKN